jgi:hypothetical protein
MRVGSSCTKTTLGEIEKADKKAAKKAAVKSVPDKKALVKKAAPAKSSEIKA